MRSEIMNALLLRKVANKRMAMEKWIGHEEEDTLIPRGRETQIGSKAMNCETMRYQHKTWQFKYSHIHVVNGL